jgi:hypothetical protein
VVHGFLLCPAPLSEQLLLQNSTPAVDQGPRRTRCRPCFYHSFLPHSCCNFVMSTLDYIAGRRSSSATAGRDGRSYRICSNDICHVTNTKSDALSSRRVCEGVNQGLSSLTAWREPITIADHPIQSSNINSNHKPPDSSSILY